MLHSRSVSTNTQGGVQQAVSTRDAGAGFHTMHTQLATLHNALSSCMHTLPKHVGIYQGTPAGGNPLAVVCGNNAAHQPCARAQALP